MCYAENWRHRIPKGQSKNGQHRETGNVRHPRRRKTSQKYNTICFRHHYAQTSTNNVYKTWTVDCVLVPAFSNLHTVLEYTNTVRGSMSLLKNLTCDFNIEASSVISQWSANHSTTPTSGNYFRTLCRKNTLWLHTITSHKMLYVKTIDTNFICI